MTDGVEDVPPEDAPIKPKDEVVRKRDFQRAKGFDVSAFMVDTAGSQETSENLSEELPEVDIAVGEVASLFSSGDDEHLAPGAVQKDGTVIKTAQMDSVTDMAVHGEQRLGVGLLIAMILTWSAIGTIVGTVLPAIPSGLGLLTMGLIGLFLGERWIPNPNMRLLGVTWVIISMKLFYGLALDAWHWGWFDGSALGTNETLGVSLLGLVGVNVFIAQRHNEDAIAAQATLILLLVGSAAGALYGQLGVAAMVGLGTLLMHGLAIYRKSGNLASLGIASSYLWVGIHALSNDWVLLGIDIVPFEDDLLLFLLMAGVTATNAIIAARFVQEENWFSQAFNSMGLGKPALWSVSVGLGMIGALLAIAAHRAETGYALAQLVLLISAFSGSYLIVRGVSLKDLFPYLIAPAPFLLIGLSIYSSGIVEIGLPFDLDGYSMYASLTALFTVIALLRNQTAVSDHVIWMGGLAIVLLLTILIPAGNAANGARLLLVTQAVVWLGLSGLAVYRNSPSIAGTAVLGPWIWLLMFATDADSRLISSDLLSIHIDEHDLFGWMSLLVIQQIWVNIRHGETGLNLAARLIGLSEVGARLRDSGMAKLWNLSFVFSVVVTWAVVRPGGLPIYGVITVLGGLLIGHALMVYFDKHQGKPQTLMSFWGIIALVLSWSYGQSSLWAMVLVVASAILLLASDRKLAEGATEIELERAEILPGQLLTMMMGFMTAFFIMIALDPLAGMQLTGTENMLQKEENLLILMCVGLVSLILYLHRAAKLEKLLPPAIMAIGLIVAMALAGRSIAVDLVVLASILAFVLSGAYLAIQGEFRAGLRALTKKENRLLRIKEKQERIQAYIESSGFTVEQNPTPTPGDESADGLPRSNLKLIDTELLNLAEKQRKRSKRTGTTGEMDLEVGDIHHQPTVVMLFLATTILATTFFSFTTGATLVSLTFSVLVSMLFVGLSRIRANQISLRLPDVLGVETPIALGMAGLVLVHVAGRASNSVVELEDATHLVVFFTGLIMLAGLGLLGRNDLGIRIPNALEAVVFLAVLDRIICLVAGGEVPIPFSTDPFDGAMFTWILPLLLIEGFVITSVIGFDWVEGKRIEHQMTDHRGAGGRSAWIMAVSILSIGPGSLLALSFGARRGVWWKQPAVVLFSWVMIPFSYLSTTYWISPVLDVSLPTTSVIASLLGVISIGFVAWVVQTRQGLWLPAGLWAVHLLLIGSSWSYGDLNFAVVFVLLCSTAAWVSGVLTLRKAWRVVGALDLVLAWVIAGVLIVQGASIEGLLIILVASAMLLGLVTYLTQTYQGEMANE